MIDIPHNTVIVNKLSPTYEVLPGVKARDARPELDHLAAMMTDYGTSGVLLMIVALCESNNMARAASAIYDASQDMNDNEKDEPKS